MPTLGLQMHCLFYANQQIRVRVYLDKSATVNELVTETTYSMIFGIVPRKHVHAVDTADWLATRIQFQFAFNSTPYASTC